MSQPQSQGRVGFLDLSAELRNCIYDLTLSTNADCISIFRRSGHTSLRMIRTTQSRQISSIILRLCHQIHDEALPVLYGSNNIEIPPCLMPQFLRQIGDNAKHIRHLMLLRRRPSLYPSGIFSFGGLRSLKLSLGPFHYESLDFISEKRALLVGLLPILSSMTANCEKDGTSVMVEDLLELDVFVRDGKHEAVKTAQWYRKSIFDDLKKLLAPQKTSVLSASRLK